MLQAVGQANVLGLLVMAALAYGFARVLDAPRWAGPAILLAVVVIAALAQLLLPTEAPLRQSTSAVTLALLWLGVAAIPVLGYRAVLRRLRPAPAAAPAHPSGFVLIADDTALTRDMAERLDTVPPRTDTFSIAHRAPDGAITAALRLHLTETLATAHTPWTAPEAAALLPELLQTAEAEARARDAEALMIAARPPLTAEVLQDGGYVAVGDDIYTKVLA